MKKITASLIVAFAALSSTAALAETPVVREMNSYDNILKVAMKNKAQSGASEFVIYHQDAHRPCPPKEKGKKHDHHGKEKHKHHKEEAKKAHKAEKAKKSQKPKVDDKKKTDDTSTSK